MKILLDSCVWGKAKVEIASRGHDVEWAGDWDTDPGDMKILSLAYEQGRTLVTLDKDFGELAIVRKMSHRGIIRLASISAREQARVVLRLVHDYGDMLVRGAILTVDQRSLQSGFLAQLILLRMKATQDHFGIL